MNFLRNGLLLLTALVVFTSCEELENSCNINEDDLATGEIFVGSLEQLLDVYTRTDMIAKDPFLNTAGTNQIDGATCTLTSDSLIIDFGINGELCADNKIRKGSIRIKRTGNYMDPSSLLEGKLQNYHVDNTPLTGNLSFFNNGPVTTPSFTVGAVDFMENAESKINYNLTFNWSSGFATTDMTDDDFILMGTMSGEDLSNVKGFNVNITEDLLYNGACADLIEQGKLNLVYNNPADSAVSTFDIDFISSDGCNNLFMATAYCEGEPINFTYPFNN